MATGTQRSKALHNFTLPSGLRWGNQRFLRCMKVDSDAQTSPIRSFNTTNSGESSDHHHHIPTQQPRTSRDRERDKDSEFLNRSPKESHLYPPPTAGGRRFSDEDGADGIAAMREKVLLDLQTAADKMKNVIFKDGVEEGEVSISPPHVPKPPPPPPPPASASAGPEASRPWNLRTRRAACKMPSSGFDSGKNGGAIAAGGGNDGASGKALKLDSPRTITGFPQMRTSASASAIAHKSPLRDDGGTAASGEKRERAKFSVPLSKREIEEDFFAMVGHRPPRRPKKRARVVQKQMDTLFPGLWLTEVTSDMYKVPESAP